MEQPHSSTLNIASGGSNPPRTSVRRRQRSWNYILNQKIRTRAYSRIFYTDARKWGVWYYGLQMGTVVLNAAAALAILMIADPDQSKRLGAAVSLVAGAIIAASTILNPAQRESKSEYAGDRYRIRSERLEQLDNYAPQAELQRAVQATAADIESLAMDTTEPSPRRLDREIIRIEEQIKRAHERCRMQSNSDSESEGGVHVSDMV